MPFGANYLVPFLLDEVLPGDHLSYDVTAYVRMQTALFPIFDNQRIDTFFFFVPNRIIWDNWTKMMGEQATPASSIAYTVPIITSPVDGFILNSIYDYFGLPISGQIATGEQINISALPLRAYNKIYNTWFRDQNITSSATENQGDGPDTYTNYSIRTRAKAHDYFTSALPWPQKFTAPNVPVAGTAPITGIGWDTTGVTNTGTQNVWETATAGAGVNYTDWHSSVDTNKMIFKSLATGQPAIYADLASATGVAINTFRQAFLVQQLLERDARGGTRYTELIRSHFGVTNPDFRLQRPEYIGGGQTPLMMTPIAQTAPTDDAPLGALGAAGTATGQHRASYAATEHGWIVGLINVRSELSYQQGIHRMWNRSSRYDFYWPSLAGLGEQAILRQEIYATGAAANDEAVFGYQERWHEYRTRYSEVVGRFRSYASGTLDAWHLAQEFSAAPTLSNSFIEEDAPVSRVLAAGELAEHQQYLADLLITRSAVRPIPTFGTPVLLGRF